MRRLAESVPVERHAAQPSTRRLVVVIAISILVRIAAALYLGDTTSPLPGIADQVSYHNLAVRVAGGHGFSFDSPWWPATGANQPTGHWSFLYVLYLAAVYGVLGPSPLAARLIQAVAVGILQPWLTHRVATRLFGDNVGVVAAAIVAGYAYFVYFAAALMTEAFFIVAVLWSIDRALALASTCESSMRRTWLQLGVSLAAAVLLRQAVLVLVPVILLWAWREAGIASPAPGPAAGAVRREATVGVVIAMLVLAAAVLPWTIRNYAVFQRVVLLNTNAGFAFFWGNHPIHGTRFVPILPDGSYAALIPAELRHLDEASLDRALLRRGFAFVRDDPGRFLRLSISRISEYVRFWPSGGSSHASNSARMLSFGLCLPFMLAGVVIARRRGRSGGAGTRTRRAGIWLLLLVAGSYSLVHLVTWALIRYRLPVDAVMVPFAALAAVRATELLQAPVRVWRGRRVTI